jgi:hypothetical protein
MAKLLVNMYDLVEEKAGREGKVALARATGIPSVIAMGTAETPELLAKFRAAIRDILGHSCPL